MCMIQNLYIEFIVISNMLLDPPNVTASTSLDGPATAGEDSAILTCNVEANPPATIRWRKEGSLKVLGSDPELVLDPVKQTDAGNYTCHVSNELGHDTSLPVEIVTYCKLDKYQRQIFHS